MDVYRKKDGLKGWLTTDCEDGDILIYSTGIGHKLLNRYNSLSKLFEDWEDYAAYKPAKPAPLIKDEKIRKAVRAWAELNSIYSVFVEIPNIHGNARTILSAHKGYVEWMLCVGMPELENNKTYTIAELCGEEEE